MIIIISLIILLFIGIACYIYPWILILGQWEKDLKEESLRQDKELKRYQKEGE